MSIKSTYTTKFTRTEYIKVTVTDAAEAEVWSNIGCGFVDDGGLTREQYEELPEDKQAEFVAERVIAIGLYQFMENTGEQLSLFELTEE